jgi:hypothetical protein
MKSAGKEFEWKENLVVDINLTMQESDDGKKMLIKEKKDKNVFYFNIHI